jgi:hypothetical protein
VDKKSTISIGGSLEKAEKGDYQLDTFAILKEAWQKTKTTKQPILVGLLTIFSLGFIITVLFTNAFGGTEQILENQQHTAFLNLLLTIVVWPFLAGVEMMGIYHSVGIKTKSAMIFSFLKRGSWVVITALLVSTLISIGLALFVVPGIFLAVVTSLAVPLVVEKKLTPLKALWLSLKALTFQWFKIFTLYFLMSLILIVSLLPFAANPGPAIALPILVLIYLAPFFYNVKGILYREIFGVQVEVQLDGEQPPGNGYFSA